MKILSFFLIFLFLLSFVSASPLANDSSGILINCELDCSCAADTCTGNTCDDGCGGVCAGIKSCGGGSSSGGSSRKYQCNDRIDNDGDGLCDFNGCYINSIRLSRDTDCESYYDNSESSSVIEEPINETIEEPIIEPEINQTEEINETIEPTIEPQENITGEVNVSLGEEEPEDYSFIQILSGILIGLILLFFGVPWLIKRLKNIKPAYKYKRPIIKPIIQKPIIQPQKTYPEIEQLKAKIKVIDHDLTRLFKNTYDRYSEILNFRNNIHNKSSILFKTYDTLNKVERKFKNED